MWPLILSALFFAFLAFIKGMAMAGAFLLVAKVLFYWYCFCGGLAALFLFFNVLISLLCGAGIGGIKGGPLGAICGVLLGGAGSLFLCLFALVGHICRIVGAFLLMTSGTPGMEISDFSAAKLVVGSIMIILPIIF